MSKRSSRRGRLPSYRPEGPEKEKPSFADGPFTLFICGSGLGKENTFFRWSMVHGQSGKIKKSQGDEKSTEWKKYLCRWWESKGSGVGRSFSGGYIFQVRRREISWIKSTFFRWLEKKSSGVLFAGGLPFLGEGTREYLFPGGLARGNTFFRCYIFQVGT